MMFSTKEFHEGIGRRSIPIPCTVSFATLYFVLECRLVCCFFSSFVVMCIMFRHHSASEHIGPRHDRERHNIGVEYELLLEETLRSMGEFFHCSMVNMRKNNPVFVSCVHTIFLLLYGNHLVVSVTAHSRKYILQAQTSRSKPRRSFACEVRHGHRTSSSRVQWALEFEGGTEDRVGIYCM